MTGFTKRGTFARLAPLRGGVIPEGLGAVALGHVDLGGLLVPGNGGRLCVRGQHGDEASRNLLPHRG